MDLKLKSDKVKLLALCLLSALIIVIVVGIWMINRQSTQFELTTSDEMRLFIDVKDQHKVILSIKNGADYQCQFPEEVVIERIVFNDKQCKISEENSDKRQLSIFLNEKIDSTDVQVMLSCKTQKSHQVMIQCRRDWSRYFKHSREFKVPGSAAKQAVKYWRKLYAEKPLSNVLDLGCGTGRDTLYYLRLNAYVTAVDYRQEALDILVSRVKDAYKNHLITRMQSWQNIKLDKNYDVVSATLSLPFIPKEYFSQALKNILSQIPSGSIFSANFFGNKHEWNVAANHIMTFVSRDELKTYFKEFDLLVLDETDRKTSTASDGLSRWHQFDVVAARR